LRRKSTTLSLKEAHMTSIADGAVIIQTSAESAPLTPSWFGEGALIAGYLRKHGVLSKINGRVRFARRRGVCYEVIDFLAVLFGYAISGERILEAFYERHQPFAVPFMALFEREQLPARSALSRFLASLTWGATEALRTLFLADLLARAPDKERHTGQLVDRAGIARVVFDIDGTQQVARQRALPQAEELPEPLQGHYLPSAMIGDPPPISALFTGLPKRGQLRFRLGSSPRHCYAPACKNRISYKTPSSTSIVKCIALTSRSRS
jgi:hypothetical protein